MNFKKILCLALCLIFAASTFVGCKDQAQSGADSSEVLDTSEDISAVVEEFLYIVKDGAAIDVVYPKRATADEIKLANGIVSAIRNVAKVSAKLKTDAEAYNAEKIEIVVGSTQYPESKAVAEKIGYGKGIICIEQNKIVVLASGKDISDAMSTKFTIALSNGKDGKDIKFARDYSLEVVDNDVLLSLPLVESLSVSDIKDAGDGSYVLSFYNATAEDVSKYATVLAEAGFSEYTKNPIDKNLYYTYVSDKDVVTLAYTDYNKIMRVIIEKKSDTALPVREADNRWSAVEGVTTAILQLGLYYDYNGNPASDYVNGMSYVIRLKDGSFVVIDGGHAKQIDSERLYNVMRKQAPDPNNIVIAAWFFTHGHDDHTGFFRSFCSLYASKVKVERFVYNFPSVDEVTDADQNGMASNLSRYFKNVPVVKAHPGQVFNLRNSKITVLFTNDLWDRSIGALSTSNEASLVLSVEMENTKFMVLGDYYDDRGMLGNLYSSSTLKSDIMQVSHHGISNCGTNLYPIIAPEWVLWPLGSDYVEEYNRVISAHPINAYMKTMDPDKVFMAKDDIVILTLDNGNISAQVFDTDEIYLAS